jgi:hypothetical protein
MMVVSPEKMPHVTPAQRLAAFVLVACSTASALADLPGSDDHALPCRPTIACTADLVPPGTSEVELGYAARRGPTGTVSETPYLLKLTATRWLQLQVSGNGAVIASGVPRNTTAPRYVDDVVVGPKFHLLDQSTLVPSLSLSAALSIPTPASQRGYLATYDLLTTLYVTKDLGWLHADFNTGLNVWRIEQEPLKQPFVALALSAALGRQLTPMIEGYAFAGAAPVAPADAGVLTALAYSPRTFVTLDLGGDVGLVRSTRAFTLFAGVTLIPAVLWR